MPTKARIPLPSVLDPLTSKCVRLRIPDDPEWEGMFWGALNQLSVWTAYQRSGDTSASDVASVWRQVFADAHNVPCPEDDRPNWHLAVTILAGWYDTFTWGNPKYFSNWPDPPSAEWSLTAMPGNPAVAPHFKIEGKANSDNSLVGGTMHIQVSSEFDPAGRVFVATLVDCLGGTTTETHFTPWSVFGDYKSIEITGGDTVTFLVRDTIDGNWLCGPS